MSKKLPDTSNKQVRDRTGGITGREDETRAAYMYARAFTNPGWMESHLHECLFRPPIYNPEHTRLVEANGEIVAGVTMAPRTMRFGPAQVPAMTIGPVGTHDHYRKQGHASAAMEDACRYMKEHGVLVAYLQGISNFYNSFGFFPYMAPGRIKIQRSHAEKEMSPGKLRRMKKTDLPTVRRIYNAETKSRIGPAARNSDVWTWLFGSAVKTWMFKEPFVILDGNDNVCGYVTGISGTKPNCAEIVVRRTEAAHRSALGAIVRQTKKREWQDLELPLPWDDPFAVFLRQYLPAQTTFQSGATGGALLKIVDFPALMEQLESLFQDRLRGRIHINARLRIVSDIGSCRIWISDGIVRIDGVDTKGASKSAGKIDDGTDISISGKTVEKLVRIPSRWLSGFITGYYSVQDICQRKGVSIPRDAVDVLEDLFPSGWPFVYQGDNY